MGRTYAGILGPLAFCVVIARGLYDAGGLTSTIWTASLCLFGFAAIGYAAGSIASSTVRQSVQLQMNKELAALEISKEEKEVTTESA